MSLLYVAVAAVLAGLTIYTKTKGRRGLFIVAKPATMLPIMALALTGAAAFPSPYRNLVVGALLLSLAGDVFLMFSDRWFLAGLVAFLLAHIVYIAAFSSVAGFSWRPEPLLIALLLSSLIVSRLWLGLGRLRLPVLLYVAAIAIMFWQAATLWLQTGAPSAGYAAAGGTFFLVSDAALALDRFSHSTRVSPLIVLGTYYLAQTLLALSA